MTWTILLVAHGTVRNLDELPAFVNEIRRGRPAPPELIAELRHRYEVVGGSPLLRITNELAERVERATGIPTRVAMRLWEPRVEDVVADLGPNDHVILVPLAPFSVAVYEAAARRSLEKLSAPPTLHCVAPWGLEEPLIDAWTRDIRALDGDGDASSRAVILSAHSLPRVIIDRGDDYARTFEATARAVERALGRPCRVAYQSQGAQDGEWLGPTLLETFRSVRDEGAREVLVAPIGFLADHIETLYDLDVEAKNQAEELGLGFRRAAALNLDAGLVDTLALLVRRVREAN